MNRLKASVPTPDELAELCLGHLAQDPEMLGEFMVVAGYDPSGLRAALNTRALAVGLLDYVVQREPLLLAVCTAGDIKPEQFMAAWHKLNPGMG